MTNQSHKATYTEGSVFGHISNLAIISAIGMFAIMIVDLVDMYFISILGIPSLAAAVGFAGLGLFLGASITIGISIAVSTVVAQALGEQNESRAQRYATHGLLYSLAWTIPITIVTLVYAEELLSLIGASGETLSLAVNYFRIVGVSLPILGLAIAANSLLRAVGAAKLSMWSTIIGGLVNAVIDPMLIFGAGLGLTGAAIASVISRITVAVIALYSLVKKHGLIVRPVWSELIQDFKSLSAIAFPSILTNLSGPISAAFATSQMARFGTDAVAAASVIGRVTPVAFAGLYGLSGAVGPVASQNMGAKQFYRVRESLTASGKFVALYVIPVTVLMYLAQDGLIGIFNLEGEAAELLKFYATFVVGSYILFGLQLSANPLFTALRHPGFATLSNIIRDLVLAIPLVFLLSAEFGSRGVLAGQALANALAGILAFATAYWMSGKVERGEPIGPSLLKTRFHRHRPVVPGVQHRG
ncbi:MAG: MATE family efflux transporter [Granulosicoccaceae bacterium]